MSIEIENLNHTDFSDICTGEAMPLITPGVHLARFIEELNITAYRLARDTTMSPIRISEIINGKRSITADTALRLGRYFGNAAQFWLNLQSEYDLRVASNNLGDNLLNQVQPLAASN